MADKDDVHGEGNYEASRRYNQATKTFVESGKVDEAAERAKPASEAEARELREAEDAGRRRAKEEDPALREHAQRGGDDKASAGPEPRFGGSDGTGTGRSHASGDKA